MVMYIQIFNKDRQPIFLEAKSGAVSWTIPRHISLSSVKYISHIDENSSQVYYEKLEDGNPVSWTLPVHEMSQKACELATKVMKMTMKESEVVLRENFNFDVSSAQMTAIDDFVEGPLI